MFEIKKKKKKKKKKKGNQLINSRKKRRLFLHNIMLSLTELTEDCKKISTTKLKIYFIFSIEY